MNGALLAEIGVMKTRFRSGSVLFLPALLLIDGAAHAQAPATERVSVATGGAQADSTSYQPSISADGRCVAFYSNATNLFMGDTNGGSDVLVRDRLSGTTECVSVNSVGALADSNSQRPSISADGRLVAFDSLASNLVGSDNNGLTDVFVRDRLSGTTERVSVDSGGAQANSDSYLASISADGRCVAFASVATNLVAGDTNAARDVFVRDRQSGTTERVSVATGGAQANSPGDFEPSTPSISADGRFVAFASTATNLVAGDTNGWKDVFVRDRQSGTTERVSVATGGAEANFQSTALSISTDGRFVAFTSGASNLVAGDTNSSADVFVRDRQSGTTQRVSLTTGGAQGNSGCGACAISADGRFVAFWSYATNLITGDTNGWPDVFVRDRQSGTTQRVSVDSGDVQGNNSSTFASISSDGRDVAYESVASNLVAGDTNLTVDIFVRDRGTPPPAVYCTAGTTTNGCNASIAASANPSLSLANACNITVTAVEGQKSGLLFYGIGNLAFVPGPWALGSTSFLCVRPPTQRTPTQNSGGTAGVCDGSYALDWNAYQAASPSALGQPWSVGAKVFAQAWFRDPPAAKSTNLSNAVELTYLP